MHIKNIEITPLQFLFKNKIKRKGITIDGGKNNSNGTKMEFKTFIILNEPSHSFCELLEFFVVDFNIVIGVYLLHDCIYQHLVWFGISLRHFSNECFKLVPVQITIAVDIMRIKNILLDYQVIIICIVKY